MPLLAAAATRLSHRPLLCGYAFRHASVLVRIRDIPAKTRSQNERITKGQVNGRLAPNVQYMAHVHCLLSGSTRSFQHWLPIDQETPLGDSDDIISYWADIADYDPETANAMPVTEGAVGDSIKSGL